MGVHATIRSLVLAGALALSGVAAEAKTLRVSIEADPAMIDPITYSEIIAGRVLDNVYESFTTETPDGEIVPMLAESWEALPEGHGFRFHLRQGVTFHSGRPFTAKDVKYTLETLLKPGMKAGLNASYLQKIVGAEDVKSGNASELTGVTIVDDHTLDISFTEPDVLFPIYPIYFMDSGIVAEHGEDWMTKVSAGTGPYKFKSWTRGVDVVLDAHEEYWGGAPKIDGIRFLVVPSADTALSQYDAGELDFVMVEPAGYRRVLQDDRYADERIMVPRAQSRYMGMNQNLYEPFKDKRVREAIAISLNQEAMIKGLYDGAAFPLNGIITPGVAGYNPDLPPIPYDPERAKQLMAEAGYPEGQGLPPVQVTCEPKCKDEITYYADQLNKVLGMPVSVNVMERATFIKSMNAGEVAFFPWGWTAGYPDAMYYLAQMWYGPSPYNRARYNNPEYDRLIEEAQGTIDEAKRYKLYQQAEKVILDDWGTAPLPLLVNIALRKPNVHNVTITPFGFSSFHSAEIE